jgi:hypothetical protein
LPCHVWRHQCGTGDWRRPGETSTHRIAVSAWAHHQLHSARRRTGRPARGADPLAVINSAGAEDLFRCLADWHGSVSQQLVVWAAGTGTTGRPYLAAHRTPGQTPTANKAQSRRPGRWYVVGVPALWPYLHGAGVERLGGGLASIRITDDGVRVGNDTGHAGNRNRGPPAHTPVKDAGLSQGRCGVVDCSGCPVCPRTCRRRRPCTPRGRSRRQT